MQYFGHYLIDFDYAIRVFFQQKFAKNLNYQNKIVISSAKFEILANVIHHFQPPYIYLTVFNGIQSKVSNLFYLHRSCKNETSNSRLKNDYICNEVKWNRSVIALKWTTFL